MAFAALCVVFLAAACSVFQVAAPKSPSQALAYAYGTVATVRQSAATALESGSISVATAQLVLKDTDAARAALDAGEQVLLNPATGASGTQATSIEGYLATATQLLTEAQKLLPQLGLAGASAPTAASAVSK